MKDRIWVAYNTVSDELQTIHDTWLAQTLLESGYLVLLGVL